MVHGAGSSAAALSQVRNHLSFGQTHAAEQIIDALLTRDALNPVYRATKALVHFKKGEFAEARNLWQGIINENPDSHIAKESLLCLAVLSADLGKYFESEGLFKLYGNTMKKVDKQFGAFPVAEAQLNIARKYEKLKKEAAAIRAANQAIQEYPGLIEAHCFLGNLYLKMDQSGKAISQLSIALEYDAENFEVWILIGKARLAEGNFREARSALTRAKSVRPADRLPDMLLTHLHQSQEPSLQPH